MAPDRLLQLALQVDERALVIRGHVTSNLHAPTRRRGWDRLIGDREGSFEHLGVL